MSRGSPHKFSQNTWRLNPRNSVLVTNSYPMTDPAGAGRKMRSHDWGFCWWDPWHTIYSSTMDPSWVSIGLSLLWSASIRRKTVPRTKRSSLWVVFATFFLLRLLQWPGWRYNVCYHLVISSHSHGKSPFLIGKPSISMGHLYHGYVK